MIEPENYLHRASFVVITPSSSSSLEILQDGAVLTEHGRIKEVAPYASLKGADAEFVDHGDSVLAPALVNCHAHIELSHLGHLGKEGGPDQPGNMASWIRKLLAARIEAGFSEDHVFVAWQALAQLYASGCRGLADVGNLPESAELGDNFKIHRLFFQEFLGISKEVEKEALSLLATVPEETLCAPHAPYSTSGELIHQIKQRATKLGHLFPIHVAESADEIRFLENGSGPFREFLEERQAWDKSFVPPACGAIEYLDRLGALDDRTLCVHGVHVSNEELDLLAKRQAQVCLCPGSNRYMGVGKAPVTEMLARGIMPVIGTDSLASNPHLNLWQEMKILCEDHPTIDPATVYRMTSGRGAEVLGAADELGSLKPGSSASFPAVKADGVGAAEVFEYLTTIGLDVELEWVE